MRDIFYPNSVAVVGVSSKPTNLGRNIVSNLIGFGYQGIRRAYPEARIDGVLVRPMAAGGRELILGGRQDAQFGPVVLAGMGGVFVEIFEEVALRVVQIGRREALAMIEELRGAPILLGARGHRRSDIEAVTDVILRLSQLLCDFPEIQELDINPLRVFHEPDGCQALDARTIL